MYVQVYATFQYIYACYRSIHIENILLNVWEERHQKKKIVILNICFKEEYTRKYELRNVVINNVRYDV